MLIDERIGRARMEYNENTRHFTEKDRKRIPFDLYLKLFTGKEISFTEIAKKLRVTVEGVRQTYENYFQPYLPGQRSGRDRMVSRRAKQWEAEAKEIPPDGCMSKIATLARGQGISVKRCFQTKAGKRRFKKQEIRLNGKVCLICQVKKQQVAVLVNHLKTLDFVLVMRQTEEQGIGELFIIPAGVMMRFKKESDRVMIWIPLKKPEASQSCRVRVDFWKYFENWYLLR